MNFTEFNDKNFQQNLENDETHNNKNFQDELENDETHHNKNFQYELEDEQENLTEEIHISTALSSKKIMELIDEYPNLKIVTCPKSIYNRISKKYLEALTELGIAVKIKYNWGKPARYTEKDRINVINLIKEGLLPNDIAEKLDISVQSVYYLKNKNKDEQIKLKRGKKRKYSYKTRKRVKKLASERVPMKKISESENIPLRTIYDIVNEK